MSKVKKEMSVIDILRIKAEGEIEAKKKELELEERKIQLWERELALREREFEMQQRGGGGGRLHFDAI